MNLLIDNNDGLGPQDYTAYVDCEHLPAITRKLNAAATMICALVCGRQRLLCHRSAGPASVLQRSDGLRAVHRLCAGGAGAAISRIRTATGMAIRHQRNRRFVPARTQRAAGAHGCSRRARRAMP